MMKRCLALAITMVLLSVSFWGNSAFAAEASPFTVRNGIAWGMSLQEVKAAEESADIQAAELTNTASMLGWYPTELLEGSRLEGNEGYAEIGYQFIRDQLAAVMYRITRNLSPEAIKILEGKYGAHGAPDWTGMLAYYAAAMPEQSREDLLSGWQAGAGSFAYWELPDGTAVYFNYLDESDPFNQLVYIAPEALLAPDDPQEEAVSALQSRLDSLTALNDTLQAELYAANEQIAGLQTEKTALNAQLEEAQAAIQEASEQDDALRAENTQLSAQLKEAQAAVQKASEQDDALRAENTQLSGQLKEAQAAVQKASEQYEALQADNDQIKADAQAAAQAADDQYAALQADCASLNARLEDAQNAAKASADQYHSLQADYALLAEKLEAAQTISGAKEEQNAALQANNDLLLLQLESAQASADALQVQYEDLQAQNDELQMHNKYLQAALDALQAEKGASAVSVASGGQTDWGSSPAIPHGLEFRSDGKYSGFTAFIGPGRNGDYSEDDTYFNRSVYSVTGLWRESFNGTTYICIEFKANPSYYRRVYVTNTYFSGVGHLPMIQLEGKQARVAHSCKALYGPGEEFNALKNSNVAKGTSITVYFEENGYVFADFINASGRVRAYLPANCVVPQ